MPETFHNVPTSEKRVRSKLLLLTDGWGGSWSDNRKDRSFHGLSSRLNCAQDYLRFSLIRPIRVSDPCRRSWIISKPRYEKSYWSSPLSFATNGMTSLCVKTHLQEITQSKESVAGSEIIAIIRGIHPISIILELMDYYLRGKSNWRPSQIAVAKIVIVSWHIKCIHYVGQKQSWTSLSFLIKHHSDICSNMVIGYTLGKHTKSVLPWCCRKTLLICNSNLVITDYLIIIVPLSLIYIWLTMSASCKNIWPLPHRFTAHWCISRMQIELLLHVMEFLIY